MILFPAIDLKDGACVRLLRGDMADATVYNDNPSDQAKAWQRAGFDWLHLVDLNGAVEGRSVNAHAVRSILDAVDIPVQLGGGIRNIEGINHWLEAGITRVILGTVAVEEPAIVTAACRSWPGRIVAGLDARKGYVATQGWTETSTVPAADLALRMQDAGVAAIVYTDIDRDGAMTGLNIEATAALARALEVPVIASGGVADLDDLRALMDHEAEGIEGVISGRALYDGRLNPKEALAILKGK